MKTTIVSRLLAVSILLMGCDRRHDPPFISGPPATKPAERTSPPVVGPMLAALERGDQGLALTNFVEADWSASPLFEPGSALNLSEEEFMFLSLAGRCEKSKEFKPQLDALKKLALVVAAAGREAATNGNPAQARKYFMSLKQCGVAMAGRDRLALVQFFGRSLKKLSDDEMSKLGREAGRRHDFSEVTQK